MKKPEVPGRVMRYKEITCKLLSILAPKIKLGFLEWDMSEPIRDLLGCEENSIVTKIKSCFLTDQTHIVCYKNALEITHAKFSQLRKINQAKSFSRNYKGFFQQSMVTVQP